jgi:enamine deaminase RidA (YjgF/YER057c/UK114 family)
MSIRLCVFVLAALLAAGSGSAQSLQFVNPPALGSPATYTHVVRAGKTLYIAGQVGADAQGKIAGPGMAEQVRQVLANLGAALASQGAGVQHVAKINIYVTDMDAFRDPETAKLRAEFFGEHKPASTLVQVVRLASPEYKVEIEAIAVLP